MNKQFLISTVGVFALVATAAGCGGGGGSGTGGGGPQPSTLSFVQTSIQLVVGTGTMTVDVRAAADPPMPVSYALDPPTVPQGLSALWIDGSGTMTAQVESTFIGPAQFDVVASAPGAGVARMGVTLVRPQATTVASALAAADGSAHVFVPAGLFQGVAYDAGPGTFPAGALVEILQHPVPGRTEPMLAVRFSDSPLAPASLAMPVVGALEGSALPLALFPLGGSAGASESSAPVSNSTAVWSLPAGTEGVFGSSTLILRQEWNTAGTTPMVPPPGIPRAGMQLLQLQSPVTTGQPFPVAIEGSINSATSTAATPGELSPQGSVCVIIPGYSLWGGYTNDSWLKTSFGDQDPLVQWATGYYDSVFVLSYDTWASIDRVSLSVDGLVDQLHQLLAGHFWQRYLALPHDGPVVGAGAPGNLGIDIICHSEGGILARRYLKEYGWFPVSGTDPRPCGSFVRSLLTLSSPHAGLGPTNVAWWLTHSGVAPACADDMLSGSSHMLDLNDGIGTSLDNGMLLGVPNVRVFMAVADTDPVVGANNCVPQNLADEDNNRRLKLDMNEMLPWSNHIHIHAGFSQHFMWVYGTSNLFNASPIFWNPASVTLAEVVARWLVPISSLDVPAAWTVGTPLNVQVAHTGHVGPPGQYRFEMWDGGLWKPLTAPSSLPSFQGGMPTETAVSLSVPFAASGPTSKIRLVAGRMGVDDQFHRFMIKESGPFAVESAPMALPDLTTSATVGSSYSSGQSAVAIPVTVNRTGGALNGGTYVLARLYWSTNSVWDGADTQLWESNGSTPDFPVSVLNSLGTKTVTPQITIPSVAAGQYYIIAVVDPTNSYAETNEGNNTAAYAVNVTTTALPDLTTSATVGSSYSSGQSAVAIPVTVNRTGGALNGGTYVLARLYWSTNSVWDGADTQLWESNGSTPDFPVSVLNSLGTKTVTPQITIPSVAAGQYYVIAVVDPTNFYTETNEGNNATTYAVNVTITGGSPTLSVSPSSCQQSTCTFTATGSNYTPNGPVQRWIQHPGQGWQQISPTTADPSGNISWSFTPPCWMPLGTTNVYAVDATTLQQSNTISELVTSNPACTGCPVGPGANESCSTAPVLSGLGCLSGTISPLGDVDWFQVTYTAADVPRTLTFIPPQGSCLDYDVEVYSSSCGLLQWSANGGCLFEYIPISAPGTYKIKVFGYAGASHPTETYTLVP